MRIEHSGASIVVLGTFRPDSFRLKALADAKVISQKDSAHAEILALLKEQVVNFGLPWASVLVDSTRLQVTTVEPPFIRICDFVVKALNDLDTKYAVRAIGINYEAHVRFEDFKARDQFAMKIAPPSGWGHWGEAVANSLRHPPPSFLHGGLVGMTLRLPFESGKVGGWRDVSVGRSDKIGGDLGVLLKSNHHHILAEAFNDEAQTHENPNIEDAHGVLLAQLSEQFDQSIKEAEGIFNQVLGL
jgi:hypothetical protein